MDRNTIIGLGIIGVILALFTYFNQPTEEQRIAAAEKAKFAQDSIDLVNVQKLAAVKTNDTLVKQNSTSTLEPKMVENTNGEMVQLTDTFGNLVFTNTVTNTDTVIPRVKSEEGNNSDVFNGETISLKNDKITLNLNTKGGVVSSVFLADYEAYDNYDPENKEEITALQLFDGTYSGNYLSFPIDGKKFSTKEKRFEVLANTESMASLRHTLGNGQTIDYIYTLYPGKFDVSYEIKVNGLAGKVTPNNVFLDWETKLLKTERLLTEQRRVSTIFFKEKNEGYDYLSEYSNDDDVAENKVDWIAFKQSYFSSIMMPEIPFGKEGTSFEIKTFEEGGPFDSTYIKDYSAHINLGLNSTDGGYSKINWFFGPNDYYVLKEYNNETEDIINLGWGIFRWVNIYAIQPLFTWLASTGINLGLAILLLTIVVKGFLTPIQWKMYTSSAKMRILKPEIEEITKKYPNKEDAMKKQMETMTLYRESGASPLSGCVPMLIQMPILFAVFRFFPSTFTLRQESFLWAEDLSSYDSIWDFGFNVPLYGDHMSLFTLLMAVTTLFYTILNSGNMQQPTQPGMPNMKYIMYFFPIMMIFFFNNFASGLSYYYFISTLMSILTMIMIKNFFVDEEKLKAKMAAKKAEKSNGKDGKKKSKFQERLEQMQKMQQDKLKNK